VSLKLGGFGEGRWKMVSPSRLGGRVDGSPRGPMRSPSAGGDRLGGAANFVHRSPLGVGGRGSGSSRVQSRSPAKSGAVDLAAGLSAKMGDLLLTDKEASGLIIRNTVASQVPKPSGQWWARCAHREGW
jgi:hypothetical protein